MASEILVASNGHASSPLLGRSATASYNGQRYTSYRLEDVEFLFGGEDAVLKFGLDENGKIISVARYENGVVGEEGVFERKNDTSADFAVSKKQYLWTFQLVKGETDNIAWEHFTSPLEYSNDFSDRTPEQIAAGLKAKIDDEIDDIKNSQTGTEEQIAAAYAKLETARTAYKGQVEAQLAGAGFGDSKEMSLKVAVDGADIGLRYADLGMAHLRISDTNDSYTKEDSYSPYVGGYDVLKVSPENLATDTNFTGTAIAGLEHKSRVDGVDQAKTGARVRNDNAVLTMNRDGTSRLVMNNLAGVGVAGKWYNVTIDKAANGTPTVTISGSNTIDGFNLPSADKVTTLGGTVSFAVEGVTKDGPEYIRKITDTQSTPEQADDIHHRFGSTIETTAYGLSNTDEHMEATARFSFSNERRTNDNMNKEEVAIYGAFGGGNPTPVVP